MPELSREERALRRLVHPRGPFDDPAGAREGPPRGPEVFDLAIQRGVGPVLAHRVLTAPEVARQLGPRATATAAALKMQTEARRARYAAGLNPWLDALRDDGVQVVLLKGAALAGSVYPTSARRLNDVDLLVPRRHAALALARMREAGFVRAVPDKAPDAHFLQASHALPFTKPATGGPLMVDVHWSLAPPDAPFALSPADILARAAPPSEAAGAIRAHVCAPEDIILHLSGQLLMDGLRFDLPRVVDLGWLTATAVDPAALARRAIEARLAGAMQVALRLGAFAGGDPLARALGMLEPANRAGPIVAELAASPTVAMGRDRLRRATAVALLPLLRDGGRRKAEQLWRLLPPTYASALALQLLEGDDPEAVWRARGPEPARHAEGLLRSAGAGLLVASRHLADRVGAASLAARLEDRLVGPPPPRTGATRE